MFEPRSASAGANGRHEYSASRTMEDMLGAAHVQVNGAAAAQRTPDGWRSPLLSGVGFRHHYDANVARGGWDFYDLGQGLCLAVVDLVASVPMPRHHSYADYLIMTAVLEGDTHISAAPGAEGDFANGCCTVYGMEAGSAFETVYEPGRVLKWISVFIDRRRLFGATGLQPQDLPARVSGFLLNGTRLPPQNVPLSRAASITAMQVLECPFQGGFRRAFLTSKALELACHLLHAITHGQRACEGFAFSNRDHEKLQRAMALIEAQLAEPPDIAELASAVGLTRQKLQLGFRLVHGDSVARVRERVRLARALSLVRSSEMAMIDIAYEIGYRHPASFTRAFKSAYGVSPADMRRTVRGTALAARDGKSAS